MSDFIITEAIDEDQVENEEKEEDEGNSFYDNEFIDDESQFEDQNFSDYYGFTNVQRSYDDAIQDSLSDFDFSQEASNYNFDDNEENFDEFQDFETKIKKFKKNLFFPHELQNENSFLCSILYAVRYHFTKKFDTVDDDEIEKDIGNIFEEIFPLKDFLKLDLNISKFEEQCYTINHILSKNNLFLRVFEQKNKFRYITNTTKEKKKIIREISSCVKEKFNGFLIIRIEFDQKKRREFLPIDIVYKPVKNQNEIINCFFTDKIHLAYRTSYTDGTKNALKPTSAFKCYFCTKFSCRKERFEKHLECCNGKAGFVYNFDTQNILTFEENLKLKHDIPLTAYIDFETTAPTDKMLDPESCKMRAVSYAIIFAFHPHLKLNRIIIERSFGHSLLKLTTIDYLTNEQLKFHDPINLKQLRDSAIEVSQRKKVNAISEMFSVELKFASDCLLKWFYSKNKKIELSLQEKKDYEVKNPIDWQEGICQICTFPLDVKPSESLNSNKITYGDFLIQKEHKFLRNVLSEDDLNKSDAIKTIDSYHEKFKKYLRICIYAESSMKTLNTFSECCYNELIELLNENLPEIENFENLKEAISEVKIKSKTKISKNNLQIYAFFYKEIMKFPSTFFESEAFTTNDLFEMVHKLLNVKIHLHHSHITGEIKGYSHDFCNWIVKENRDVVSCIAHNFFKFDLFFVLKNIRLSVWRTKDVNIGGKNLTDINFASIDNFKFIDTLKYYQTSLAQLSETATNEEKEKIQKLTVQFLTTHDHFSKVWKNLTYEQRKKVVDIISSGKGVIPYEKIETINSLSIVKPEDGIFFSKDEFFSTLKDAEVDNESYENSKKLYILLQMRNLSDLNDLYNVQDVIILLEIIENRFQIIQDKTNYNPRIINSASKLSGCIQREKSKCILALPINNVQMEVFEKTVCGGFSSVNNRLSFDSEILMPNLKAIDYDKMNIDESFKAYKRNDLKVVFSLKLDNEGKFSRKRVISKIVKLDENNQYGYAMTKPMPTGCIKENNNPSWLKFNLLLETVTLEDKIGHLFIVDIEFDEENAGKREYYYNEIFPPIIEKEKKVDVNERSLFQLLELFEKTEDAKPKSYRVTAKSHATLFPKKCIPLYIEDLQFLIKRAGWIVTKLYSHLTFEQGKIKKDFVLMNQYSRQNAKNDIEKNFYKLMNNSNFGFDCRNNANNLKFEPLINEIEELSYIKKYHNLFDEKVKQFVSSNILEQKINQDFEQEMSEIKENDQFKDIRITELKNRRDENFDALELFKKKEKRMKKRKVKDDFFDRKTSLLENRRIKTMIDFEENNCSSIKSLVVKSSQNIKVSSRFIKGKMLMFAKLSIKSFVYDMIDVFCFPNEKIQEIYSRYQIEKCFLYQNLTDTDSSSLFFVFICNMESTLPENEARKVIFECMINSKIFERLDISDDFWKNYNVQDKSTKKVMGLFEIENIDNPNICTIAVNPKEYFEKFRNRGINKKHKGVRRDTKGMDFERYASRIKDLRLDLENNVEKEKIVQKRLQVKNTEMIMTSTNKVKFAQINDKRYYFSDGIVSLPFGHPSLEKIRNYKKSLKDIHKVINDEKNKLLKDENEVVNLNERLRILRAIYSQPFKYYTLKTNRPYLVQNNVTIPTKHYILNSHWL